MCVCVGGTEREREGQRVFVCVRTRSNAVGAHVILATAHGVKGTVNNHSGVSIGYSVVSKCPSISIGVVEDEEHLD